MDFSKRPDTLLGGSEEAGSRCVRCGAGVGSVGKCARGGVVGEGMPGGAVEEGAVGRGSRFFFFGIDH
jgi:hypothetical protein